MTPQELEALADSRPAEHVGPHVKLGGFGFTVTIRDDMHDTYKGCTDGECGCLDDSDLTVHQVAEAMMKTINVLPALLDLWRAAEKKHDPSCTDSDWIDAEIQEDAALARLREVKA